MVGLNRTHQTSHAVRESSQKRISRLSESKFAQYELLKSWYWHGKPQSACPSICQSHTRQWLLSNPHSLQLWTTNKCLFRLLRFLGITSSFHNLYQHTWFDVVFGKFIFAPLKSSSPLMTCNSSCWMWSNFFTLLIGPLISSSVTYTIQVTIMLRVQVSAASKSQLITA